MADEHEPDTPGLLTRLWRRIKGPETEVQAEESSPHTPPNGTLTPAEQLTRPDYRSFTEPPDTHDPPLPPGSDRSPRDADAQQAASAQNASLADRAAADDAQRRQAEPARPEQAAAPSPTSVPPAADRTSQAALLAQSLPPGMAKEQLEAQAPPGPHRPEPQAQQTKPTPQERFQAQQRSAAHMAAINAQAAANNPVHAAVQLRNAIAADNLEAVEAANAVRYPPAPGRDSPHPAPSPALATAVPVSAPVPPVQTREQTPAPSDAAVRAWTSRHIDTLATAAAAETTRPVPQPGAAPGSPPPETPSPMPPEPPPSERGEAAPRLEPQTTATPTEPSITPVNGNGTTPAPPFAIDDRSTFAHLTDTRLDDIVEDLGDARANDNHRGSARAVVSDTQLAAAIAQDGAAHTAVSSVALSDQLFAYHSQAARDLVEAYMADPQAFEADNATRSPAMEALVAETLAAEAQGVDVAYRSPAMEQLVAETLAAEAEAQDIAAPYRSMAMEALAAEAAAAVEAEAAAGAAYYAERSAEPDAGLETTDARAEGARYRSMAAERLAREVGDRSSETSEVSWSRQRDPSQRDSGAER